jgi:acetylornithine deacetylase/succinyl-diaminopimelate desuccinylase-like protein
VSADQEALASRISARERPLVEGLKRWVEIPSISTDPERSGDVQRSAEFLREYAIACGMKTAEVWATAGHPTVFAERIEDPDLPTVLVYGHHDVQPVDPVEEWELAPFQALERDGLLLGRGTADDKGHILMHLEAVRGILDARGRLPINLKLIAEGEEEDGSEHFEATVRAHRERLACDVAVISDTGMLAEDLPGLTVALRGMAYWEVRVRTAETDLHSGVYGGAVLNPIAVLADILAGLYDRDGRVTVPGFYDRVLELSAEERRQLAQVPLDERSLLAAVGATAAGEAGYSLMERRTTRPTLEICGIWGGYQGEGAKTVIPARAAAKLSSRLVPNQDATEITRLVGDHLRRAAPPGVALEFELIHDGRWVLTPTSHPAVDAAARAISAVWGKEPVFIREGGSIPPVATIADELAVPCVLFGVGLPGDHIHAPNERVVLSQLFRGMQVLGRLWDGYSELGREGLSLSPD